MSASIESEFRALTDRFFQSRGANRNSQPGGELFLIGFLVLFLELAAIRWFAAYVVFLQFFTNLVLIACFLGMSIGCLCARQKTQWLKHFPVLLSTSVLLALVVGTVYKYWSGLEIDVGNQGSAQLVYFGTEWRSVDLAKFVIPIELLAGTFFVLITLMFVGLGQVLGQRFDAYPNRVRAYTLNIGGSLAGIVAFAGMCYAQLAPALWFLVAFVVVGWFLRQSGQLKLPQLAGLALAGLLICLMGTGIGTEICWSPYYKVSYDADKNRDITVNTISHQQMISFDEPGASYSLPYLLARDSGMRRPGKVLIIGAGSGNDVSHALHHGAEEVEAVEIDPVIAMLGKKHHPDRPYDDPRVRVHLADGRNFVRGTRHKYDLAVYALVDSLILHSSYSNIRLESFLFTEDAFRDVKAVLDPDGLFVMYNYFRQGWIIHRICHMLENVFGEQPLVFSLPYVEAIEPGDDQRGRLTMLVAGNTRALARSFERHKTYWLRRTPGPIVQGNGFTERPQAQMAFTSWETGSAPYDILARFGKEVPGTDSARIGDDREKGVHADPVQWLRIEPSHLSAAGPTIEPASDDWPFLYLRSRMIPWLSIRGMLLIAALSLAMLYTFAPGHRLGLNGHMFFLGAAFMLLETKAVVQLALLFGSTWIVNSVVFFAVLVMILGSNLYVAHVPGLRIGRHYAGLFLMLALNCMVNHDVFLAGTPLWKYGASCALVFLPIFFAGVIFARSFRDSAQPDRDFGANIAGAVTGGLAEYSSMLLGFKYLLVVAMVFYALSAILRRRLPGVA